MFEAVKTAQLEIHTGMMASAILSDTIPCASLILEAEPVVTGPPGSIGSVRVGEVSTSDEPQDVGAFVA